MSDNIEDEQVPEQEITEDMANNAAAALAGLEELAMLDNGALEKIEKIETNIFYRQFYFPGGEAVKRMPGLGTDTATIKYDQIPGDRDLFTRWDPRYLDDYIQQAQQNGFHRHFLFYDGNSVKTISFDEAYERLLGCLDGTTVRTVGGCSNNEIYGILAGLQYMGKLEPFMDEFKKDLGLSLKQVENMIKLNGSSIVSAADKQLKRVIGQTSDEFINKDYGWQAEDQIYAFDISQYADEWNSLQEQYQDYKNKIWEILKNTNALNLCTNKTSGIQVGDVNIQQSMDCAMRIGDAASNVDEQATTTSDGTTTEGNTPTNVELEETKKKQEELDNQQDELLKQIEELKKQQEAEEAAKEAAKEAEQSRNTMIIVVTLIVMGLLIIGVSVYFLLSGRKKETETKTEEV